MADETMNERDYRVALRAALAINATGEALEALANIGAAFVRRGLTQEGANVLVYVMHHPDVRYDTFDQAEDLFMQLEEHACPRLIEDARSFRLGKSLAVVAAYADAYIAAPGAADPPASG
jgi:hypothetical protein